MLSNEIDECNVCSWRVPIKRLANMLCSLRQQHKYSGEQFLESRPMRYPGIDNVTHQERQVFHSGMTKPVYR